MKTPRPIGRPSIGPSEATMVRIQTPVLKKIDDFARSQPTLIGRPEAIRRLVLAGLSKVK